MPSGVPRWRPGPRFMALERQPALAQYAVKRQAKGRAYRQRRDVATRYLWLTLFFGPASQRPLARLGVTKRFHHNETISKRKGGISCMWWD